MLLSTVIAILIHEAGHLCAALLMRIPVRGVKLSSTGVRLYVGGRIMAFWEEFYLAAAGPMAGFILSLLSAPLWSRSSFFFDLSRVSFLLGALNLLPVMSFDGGRILLSFLSLFLSPRRTRGVMRALSFATLFLLWTAAVYFLLRAADGLSLLTFTMTLFWHFFLSEEMV